ncbi:CirA Outer membrane receptor proteins, mostly Fe transport [Candidatus Methylopumilus universalis]|uniref:TonB-dependent receptor family protein n=1 Tax=Candidatus Methylopumilus universalis TaxID=2588536 RepID=UPI003BEF45A5
MKIRLLLLSLFASTSAFADDVRQLSPTVVTATRYETNSFDLPLSIDAVTGSEIRDARTGANLSEIAPRIPGVVINYRSTAAQELSISTRGFGARSQFGVKGIRIYADGIPLNSADGQGQAGSINIDTLGQIEFLRGPFSALYGNSSGGVVQAFTRDGAKDPTITVGASSGTWNTNKQSITYEGQAGPVNYILNTYQYVSDGYREHSQHRRDNFNGKISYQFSPDTKFTFVGNYMDQPYTNDPNALTPDQYKANSRSAGTGAISSNSRLYRVNSYGGVIIDHNLSEKDSLRFMAYSGERSNLQYLTTSAAAEIKRETEGFDFRWTRKDLFLNKPLNLTAGLAYDSMEDIRSRYTYSGTGVYSPLGTNSSNRREKQTAFNVDQYLQLSYEPTDRFLVIAGLRNSRVSIKNNDLFLTDGIDSTGQVTYSNTSPVGGLTFKVTPTLNVYANYGRGFETPTFAETTYSNAQTGAGPNLSMVPSKSKNYEIGLKAFVTSNTRVNLALFKVDTKNEIIVVDNKLSQNQYDSTANTERKGIEFSLDSRLPYNFNFYQTYTYLDSEFKNSFTNTVGGFVAAGNRLSGVYKNTAYSELSWKYPAFNFSSAIENIYYSDVNGYDSNAGDRKAEAFSIVNLRASLKQSYNNWSFSEFVRADNIFDEKYVGNVRVNNSATFEPGAPRNYTVGITSSYTFK